MEAFVAILQLDAGGREPLHLKAEAGLRMVRAEGTQAETFMDTGFAMSVQRRIHASDTYCARIGATLFYVQGCVEPLAPLPFCRVHRLAEDKVLPAAVLDRSSEAAGLSGSFHVVAYRFDTRQLTVILDRLAFRPVFVYRDPHLLILASDIRAILGVPGVDCSLDVESLAQFVRLQIILGERTLYQGIHTLTSATVLRARVQEPTVETETYWTMAPLDHFRDRQEAIHELAATFLKAGERISRGSRRRAVLLSGGMDSRLVLAVLCPHGGAVEAYTFAPALTDEAKVAHAVARAVGVDWHFVPQEGAEYWERLPSLLPALRGSYSIAHAHTLKILEQVARSHADTVYDGWGLDVMLSGSYLPREVVPIAGRHLYTNRLARLRTTLEAKSALLRSFDIQHGEFSRSFLSPRLRAAWTGTEQAIAQGVDEMASHWMNPYDQYEKFLSAGFAKFRSFPGTAIGRLFMRQRNLFMDAAVIDASLRLSLRERFLGPVYRQALRRINPQLARIVYSNVGTSLLAPPVVQAIVWQVRQFGRANRERVRQFLGGLALGVLQKEFYGCYPTPQELAEPLRTGISGPASSVRRALTDGLLAQSALMDVPLLRARLDGGAPMDDNEATTLLAWASLAAWLDQYPAKVAL